MVDRKSIEEFAEYSGFLQNQQNIISELQIGVLRSRILDTEYNKSSIRSREEYGELIAKFLNSVETLLEMENVSIKVEKDGVERHLAIYNLDKPNAPAHMYLYESQVASDDPEIVLSYNYLCDAISLIDEENH